MASRHARGTAGVFPEPAGADIEPAGVTRDSGGIDDESAGRKREAGRFHVVTERNKGDTGGVNAESRGVNGGACGFHAEPRGLDLASRGLDDHSRRLARQSPGLARRSPRLARLARRCKHPFARRDGSYRAQVTQLFPSHHGPVIHPGEYRQRPPMGARTPSGRFRFVALRRSLVRAAEWVADGVARVRHDQAQVLGDRGLSPHVAAAGAVEVAALAVDLVANPAVAPVVALGAQAVTLGLATDAAMRAARRRGADEARARAVLALAIAHAEQSKLCSSYEASAWRIVCRLPRPVRNDVDDRGGARSLARDGARAVMFAALSRALPKSAVKRAPWAPAALRLAMLPGNLFAGARLVAAVEEHAEMLCGAQRVRRDVNRGATPASAASTVEPLLTTAATPGVIRPRAPSAIAAALGAITRPRPLRTVAIA